MKLNFFLGLILVSMFVVGSVGWVGAVECNADLSQGGDSCTVSSSLTLNGSYVVNMNSTGSPSRAIIINAENLTFDANWTRIYGNFTIDSRGIYINKNNITIKNIIVDSYNTSIRIDNSANNLILENVIIGNSSNYGFRSFNGFVNLTMINVTFLDSAAAFYSDLNRGNNIQIINCSFNDTKRTREGITLTNAINSTIINNIFYGFNPAIRVNNATLTYIKESIFRSNDITDSSIRGSSGLTNGLFINNNQVFDVGYFISAFYLNNTILYGNNITNATLFFSDLSNNINISNNIINGSNNNVYALSLNYTNITNIIGNSFDTLGRNGIRVAGDSNIINILRNSFSNAKVTTTSSSPFIYIRDIESYSTNDIIIDSNYLNSTSNGFITDGGANIIMRNNIIENMKYNGDSYSNGGLILDTKNITLLNNTIRDVGCAGLLITKSDNVSIINNTISTSVGFNINNNINCGYEPTIAIAVVELWKTWTQDGQAISADANLTNLIGNYNNTNIYINNNILSGFGVKLKSQGTIGLVQDINNYWYRSFQSPVYLIDRSDFYIDNSYNNLTTTTNTTNGQATPVYYSDILGEGLGGSTGTIKIQYKIYKEYLWFKNVNKTQVYTTNLYQQVNSLQYNINGYAQICNDECSFDLSPNNETYVLDNYNITEGYSRDYDPIWFSSSTSTTKHIASNLSNTINTTVVFNVTSNPQYIDYRTDTSSFTKRYYQNEWNYSSTDGTITIQNIPIEPATNSNEFNISYAPVINQIEASGNNWVGTPSVVRIAPTNGTLTLTNTIFYSNVSGSTIFLNGTAQADLWKVTDNALEVYNISTNNAKFQNINTTNLAYLNLYGLTSIFNYTWSNGTSVSNYQGTTNINLTIPVGMFVLVNHGVTSYWEEAVNLTINATVNNNLNNSAVWYDFLIDMVSVQAGFGQAVLNWVFNLPATINQAILSLRVSKTDLNGTTLCYQETANVSTSCGGLGTGNYNPDGNWGTYGTNLIYDGIWDAENNYAISKNYSNLYVNYTIPNNIYGAVLRFAGKNVSTGPPYEYYETNLTIDDTCLANEILQVHIAGNRSLHAVNITCNNNTNEIPVYYDENNWYGTMVEEGIYWNISNYEVDLSNTTETNYTIVTNSINPSITITYPTATNYTTTSLELNWTYTEPNTDSAWYSLNGAANLSVTYYDNTTTFTAAQGTNTIILYLNDTSGNIDSDSITFFVDSINPLISFGTNTEENNSYKSRTNIYINTSWTESNFKNITFKLNSNITTYTAATYSQNFTSLSEGIYYYNVTLCDIANNCNSTETRKITLDTTNPVIAITSPTENEYINDNTKDITYAVVDTNLNTSTCVFTTNSGSTNTTCTNINSEVWSEGNITLTIYQYDYANNLGSATRKFFIDTIAPNATIITPSSGSGGSTGYVNNSNVNFSFNVVDLANYSDGCYQEFANISTTCGGLNTGSYYISCAGRTGCNPSYAYDGNWSTQTYYTSSSAGVTRFYVNYTVISENATLIFKDSAGEYNVSIPTNCLKQTTLQLTFDDAQSGINDFTRVYCYNGTTFEAFFQGDTITVAPKIYEEAILWQYGLPSGLANATLNITSNLTGLQVNVTTWSFSNLWRSLVSVVVGLVDGVYDFAITVYDKASNVFTSETYQITVDTINPNITILNPKNSDVYFAEGNYKTFDFNYTINDTNINYCYYKLNSGTNTNLTECYGNFNISINTSSTDNTIRLTAIDNATNTISTNKSFEVVYATSVTVPIIAYNTQEITSTINVTYDPILFTEVTAILINNRTNYTSTKAGPAGNVTFTSTTYAPSNGVNSTLYWVLRLRNSTGSYYSFTTSEYLYNLTTPTPAVIAETCPAGLNASITWDFGNEASLTIINSTISTVINYGYNGNPSAYTINTSLTNIASFSLCTNWSQPAYTLGYGEIQYYPESHVSRRYYTYNTTQATNITQFIRLYSLNTSDSTSFLITAQNNKLTPYINYYISSLRWYPGTDEYKLVEMAKTDDKGQTVMKFKTEDVDYRLGIYSTDGTLIKLLNPIRMVCLVSPCSYNIYAEDEETDYSSWATIEHSLTYNSTLQRFTYIWSDSTQKTDSMNLTIFRRTAYGDTVVCDDYATGFTGVLTCDVVGQTGTLMANVYRTASPTQPIKSLIVEIKNTITNLAGSENGKGFALFMMFFLVALMALIGIFNPFASIILGFLALIPVFIFGGISLTVFLGIGVLAGIVIHFIRRS